MPDGNVAGSAWMTPDALRDLAQQSSTPTYTYLQVSVLEKCRWDGSVGHDETSNNMDVVAMACDMSSWFGGGSGCDDGRWWWR